MLIADTIIIKEKDYPFVISFRAMLDFEKIQSKTVDNMETMEDFSVLAWCAIKAGARKEGQPFEMTIDDWYDILDEDLSLMTEVAVKVEKMGKALAAQMKGAAKKKVKN